MAHDRRLRHLFSVAVSTILVGASVCPAEERSAHPAGGLADLSIEELMAIEVVSPTKKRESVATTAAAVYVVTSDDIRRSGATSVPEALRRVPGLEVASIDNSRWAISARGTNGLFVDKLLVLIDGRSIYIPLFSGVYWDEHDLMLEDIDRIEVIRGPGGSLWGANAVLGIINIITKSASQTQGTLVSAGAGTEQRAQSSVRYGATIGDETAFRVYAKYFNRDDGEAPNGGDAKDASQGVRGGFRTDTKSGSSTFTISGDLNHVEEQLEVATPLLSPPFLETESSAKQATGGNLLGRWNEQLDEERELQLQVSVDGTKRSDVVEQKLGVVDIDSQLANRIDGHEVLAGIGYRFLYDRLDESEFASLTDEERSLNRGTAFLQDEITLTPERLFLIVGGKLEYYDEVGFELMPNVRMRYTPSHETTLWGAVSRAVHTPSRAEEELRLLVGSSMTPDGRPVVVTLTGNDDDDTEDVWALELGARRRLSAHASVDLATYWNFYDNVQTFESLPPIETYGDNPFVEQPLVYDNLATAQSVGAEVALIYEPLRWWRLRTTASIMDYDVHRKPGSSDRTLDELSQDYAKRKLGLRSSVSLSESVELDVMFRYVSPIESLEIADYAECDVRLGWKLADGWELALVGANLLHDSHSEFRTRIVQLAESDIERSFFALVTWRH